MMFERTLLKQNDKKIEELERIGDTLEELVKVLKNMDKKVNIG